MISNRTRESGLVSQSAPALESFTNALRHRLNEHPTRCSCICTTEMLLPSLTTQTTTKMSFLLQRPLFGCATAALGLSGATYGMLSYQRRTPLRLDSSSDPISSSTSPKDWSFSQYQHDAQTPVVNSRGGLNAKAVRQMTLGSILGTALFQPLTKTIPQS